MFHFWEWYVANRDDIAPLLAPLGSVVVGLGTVLVGGLVARAALRQARTATEVAHIANRQAEIAAVRHDEQTRADRQRRVTEAFSKAVEQLAHEKTVVRLGGIYTLERLAGEAPVNRRATEGSTNPGVAAVSELYWTVMETLTGFVRERARWNETDAAPEVPAKLDPYDQIEPATDVAAVLAVIRRRPDAARTHETEQRWRLDLSQTDLRGAGLSRAHLEGARLSKAHLEGTHLIEAHLEGAHLIEAHLEGAYLMEAHLESAYLIDAHFEGARLEGADLSGAHLAGVDLRGAIGDAKTILPEGIPRPTHWPAYAPD
jgi:hypothetical protein